jgi:hypothetical protein
MALATGGEAFVHDNGRASLEFPVVTVSRDVSSATPSNGSQATAPTPAEPIPLSPAAGASRQSVDASPDIDAISEQVLERLRRELLIERERLGTLIDLP